MPTAPVWLGHTEAVFSLITDADVRISRSGWLFADYLT